MVTFKAVVIPHHKKEDGTWNIKIRVTHNRQCRYIPTPFFADKQDMTRSFKLKNRQYADATDEIIRKYRHVCDRIGDRIATMPIDDVMRMLKSGRDDGDFDLDIVAYARQYIARLKESGHEGNANAYKVAINSLVKFAGREDISIHEITVRFLNQWISWIMEQPTRGNVARGTRAPNLYIAQLRAIHNRAKREYNDEDAGIIRIPYSPFGKVDLPKQSVARKRALPVEALRKLAALPYRESNHVGTNRFNLAKDIFLLSFALIGMNAADLYSCSDFDGDKIRYERTKTRNRRADKAEFKVRVEPEYRHLFDKYRDIESSGHVFRFHRMYASVAVFTTALNKGLKMVGKAIGVEDLEFYAARHTWATIALNEAGVDKYTVHQALNHVDEKMKVTDFYIKKSWKPIDEANRRVTDFCGLAKHLK